MRPAPLLLFLLLAAPGASPAWGASPFDGTYRGAQETLRANGSGACAKMDRKDVVIRIVDGRFTRSWGTNTSGGGDSIELQIKPDGSFSGSVAALSQHSSRHGTRDYSMSGKITDGVLDAEIGSNLCAVRMKLRKG